MCVRVCAREECASALACSGHVDDVWASLCGRTIIQRARGWIVESGSSNGSGSSSGGGSSNGRAGGNLAGRRYAEEEGAGEWWRSSARWSISRGRLLDLQLHPRWRPLLAIRRRTLPASSCRCLAKIARQRHDARRREAVRWNKGPWTFLRDRSRIRSREN